MIKKELLDGYCGVKFNSVCKSHVIPYDLSVLFKDFKYNTERLKENNMTNKNAGNISCTIDGGLIITSSGSNLAGIDISELIYVSKCSVEEENVYYYGKFNPSSETLMHYLIYQQYPEAKAVVHAHDEIATSGCIPGELKETIKEEPYGTPALAKLAIETFRSGENIILLKNHGYVSMGNNLTEATDIIINMHRRLMGEK